MNLEPEMASNLAPPEDHGMAGNYNDYVNFTCPPEDEIGCTHPFSINMGRSPTSHFLPHPAVSNTHWLPPYPPHISPPDMPMMGIGTAPETPPDSSPSNASHSPSPPNQSLNQPHHDSLKDEKWAKNNNYANNAWTEQQPFDLSLQAVNHIQDGGFFPFDRNYDPHLSLQRQPNILLNNPHQHHAQPPSVPVDMGIKSPISDDELVTLSVRDLNKKLHKFPKDVQVSIKQRRRTLKNRGYAQSCRQKRQTYRTQLESNNDELKRQLNQYREDNMRLKSENSSLRQALETLNKKMTQHHHTHQQHQYDQYDQTPEHARRLYSML